MKLKGFTLIEVLITLILLAGLSLLSFSSSSFLRHKNERQLIIDELRTAVQYAKIQAINLGHPVSLSPFDIQLNWSKGMILTQHNSKTNKTDILYQWQWHHPHWNITWSGINSPNRIILSNNPISAISNGKFILIDLYTKERVVIILNKLGRIRVKSATMN